MSGRDRRELAVLALVALLWGLVAAPLLHSLAHAHGHSHHHLAGRSVEHLQALGVEAPEVRSPVLVLARLERAEPERPQAPWVAGLRREAEPQGP